MASDSPTKNGPDRSESMVGAWSRRYLFVLLAVATLVVVDQAIVQPMLVGLSVYAPKINLAGRQRMLSQKVCKEGLALASMASEVNHKVLSEQLLSTVRQWKTAHQELAGAAADLAESSQSPIQTALHQLDAPLANVVQAATRLATEQVNPAEKTRLLRVMLDQESQFLSGMEQVVAMLEQAAEREVFWLRLSGLAILVTILLLLTGVYFTVLRPATRLIRDQLEQLSASELEQRELSRGLTIARDELEERVAARTSELCAANKSLANEIAERQAVEQRMRQLADQLAHASRVTALGQLATGLAHEINQPLACIVSYSDTAELLLEQPPADLGPVREAIAQVKQAALRAGSIVRRMRNFVRRSPSPTTRGDLNELVREVCCLCRPQLDESGVQLILDITSGSLPVEVEPIEIQQVLVNLVQNAVQALGECPRDQRRLNVRTWTEVNEVFVELVDSGPGFSSAQVEDSFSPFYSTKAEGLGLGLAIGRTLIERCQGRLWAEQRTEGGARVVLGLPRIAWCDIETGVHADRICR